MSILKIGHRGAGGYAPENTLASFREALDMKADGVEFDIQLSKDGEPMVIHDDTLNRTTNGKGNVSDYTYEELRRFDAGGSEKIPHLNDVLALANKRCHLFIELKVDATPQVEKIIREAVANGWRYDQLWVLSFNHAQLVEIQRLNPHIKTCASFEKRPDVLPQFDAIGPCFSCLDQALMNDARKQNLKVFTWTVNDPADIAKAKALGPDAIIGDFPDRL